MSELHILNGDFALKIWQESGFSGKSLVWKETYIEGPLPQTEDLHIFRTVRAEFLSHFAEISGLGTERLCRHLQKMDDAVLNISGSLMLWFDSCIFDQTLLMRILLLLTLRCGELPAVFLYCCPGNCLTAEDFQRGKSEKLRLIPRDFQLASCAWHAFQAQDREKMIFLAQTEDFERLPAMKKALLRCAEEICDSSGLNRTRRQILKLIAEGHCSFSEIFKGLDRFEELPFLSDTACLRHLDFLVENGFLVRENGCFKIAE
jgi:hypothetical protein